MKPRESFNLKEGIVMYEKRDYVILKYQSLDLYSCVCTSIQAFM